jgi:ATP-dependent RNA helicase RhlE
MVDMGFAPDLNRILRLLPDERQTLMFSATMPPDLNKVAKQAMRDPGRVDLAPSTRPAAGITQAVYPVVKHLKTPLLDELLRMHGVGSVIVFSRTKHGADRLARQLDRLGHSVAALHGDRTQGQRERALSDLRRGKVQVLVATDIASRGIDVTDITHVVNYDVPHTPEDYVHRIGRTGRVDALGDAFTLMSPEEAKDLTAIERFLGKAIPRVIFPDFDYKAGPPAKLAGIGSGHGASSGRGAGGGGGRGRDGGGGGGGRGRSGGGSGGGRGGSERGGRTGSAHGVTVVRTYGASGATGSSTGSSSASASSGGSRTAAPAGDHGRRPKSADNTRRGRRRI